MFLNKRMIEYMLTTKAQMVMIKKRKISIGKIKITKK